MEIPSRLAISISNGTIVKTVVYLFLFSMLFYVSDFVVTLLVAVVIASSIEPLVAFFARIKVSRGMAVVFILLGLTAVVATALFVLLPPIIDDLVQFVKTLPALLQSVTIYGRDLGFKDMAQVVSSLSKDLSAGQILGSIQNGLFGNTGFFATTSAVFSSIINIIITFVIAFYLATEEKGVQKFLRLITPRAQEEYIAGLWARSQRKIALWMQGQMLLSFVVSMLIYIPLLILQVPYATLLAVLVFLGELVPVVGLLLSIVPALLLAFVHGGASLLLIVLILYVIVGQLENHVLYPKIMSRAVGVPPVIVIIALILGAKLAGIWGVLLAVPVASIFMEFVADMEKKRDER